MKNRPSKPGIHWYRNKYDGVIYGTLIGRPYGLLSGPLMVYNIDDDGWCGMNHFEECDVAEWLGPAHPPNKINRKRLSVDDTMTPYIIDDPEGHLVFYDDVKEFSLEDE